jgi:hypothetical protein
MPLDQGRSGQELTAGAQGSPGVMSMAHPACGPEHAVKTFIQLIGLYTLTNGCILLDVKLVFSKVQDKILHCILNRNPRHRDFSKKPRFNVHLFPPKKAFNGFPTQRKALLCLQYSMWMHPTPMHALPQLHPYSSSHSLGSRHTHPSSGQQALSTSRAFAFTLLPSWYALLTVMPSFSHTSPSDATVISETFS